MDENAGLFREPSANTRTIVRHTGLDRKTVRAHLAGERQAGVRASSGVDPFDAVADYVRQWLVEDPHVRATVLFGEAQKLGYGASYATFVRRIRMAAAMVVSPKMSPQALAPRLVVRMIELLR